MSEITPAPPDAADALTQPIPAVAPVAPVANGMPPEAPGRPWWPWAVGGVLAVAAVATVLVLLVFGSSSGDEGASYKAQVATVLAPVIAANRDLSSALEALEGTKPTLARRRLRAAQSATTAARGGLSALPVPKGAEQVVRNARGTLTREAAYLDAVDIALADPGSGSAAQTQTLGANLTGALDVIAPAGEDWSQSVTGANTLTGWAPKAVAAKRRKAAAARNRARRASNSAPSGSVAVGGGVSGGADCGGGVHAGPNTSCPFARNVRDAYYEAPGSAATVSVYSPVTGQTYTMSCSPAGSGVTCSGGNNASVSWTF